MTKFHTFFTCCMLFLGINLLGFSQDVRNVDIVTSDEKMIITYDLYGKKNTFYNVALMFKKEDGSQLRPKSLEGDVGNKVTAGKGKSIIWEVYKDVDELQGSIEPVWKVQESKSANIEPKTPAEKVVEINKKKRKKKKVRLGWKSTLASSNVIANQGQNSYDNLLGLQGGLYFRWNVSRKFYVQPELLYSRQSYKFIESPNQKSINHLHYGTGQVLLGLSPFKGGLYLNGGAYYSQLFRGIEKQEGQINNTNNLLLMEDTNGNNPINPQDYGFLAGATLSFGKGAFALGILYSQGLNNIVNNDYNVELAEPSTLELNNKMLQFYFQFGF